MTDIFDRASELEERQREEAIARHKASVTVRKGSHEHCGDCGDDIPAKRREAVPGCTRCIKCERAAEVRASLMKF